MWQKLNNTNNEVWQQDNMRITVKFPHYNWVKNRQEGFTTRNQPVYIYCNYIDNYGRMQNPQLLSHNKWDDDECRPEALAIPKEIQDFVHEKMTEFNIQLSDLPNYYGE